VTIVVCDKHRWFHINIGRPSSIWRQYWLSFLLVLLHLKELILVPN